MGETWVGQDPICANTKKQEPIQRMQMDCGKLIKLTIFPSYKSDRQFLKLT